MSFGVEVGYTQPEKDVGRPVVVLAAVLILQEVELHLQSGIHHVGFEMEVAGPLKNVGRVRVISLHGACIRMQFDGHPRVEVVTHAKAAGHSRVVDAHVGVQVAKVVAYTQPAPGLHAFLGIYRRRKKSENGNGNS